MLYAALAFLFYAGVFLARLSGSLARRHHLQIRSNWRPWMSWRSVALGASGRAHSTHLLRGWTAAGFREVWDSGEQPDAFGEHMMPVLADVGIDPR
jgi:hypothetical protein